MTELSSNKVIAKNAVFLYVRMFFVMIISLISVRLLLSSLGVVDYGLYNAIGGVVTSLSFLTSILANASQRYFSYELGKKDGGRISETFSTLMFVYVTLALVLFLILQFGGIWFLHNKMIIPDGRMEAAEIVLTFSTLTFLIGVISNPLTALIIAYEDMNVYAIISIVDAILKLLAAVMLLLPIKSKLETYSIVLFAVACMTAYIYIMICYRKYKNVTFGLHVEPGLLKEIVGFSGWTMFGSLANLGYTQGLNIMLNVFIGPLANAAYAIGNQVSIAVNSLGAGFFSAMRPSIIKSIAANKFDYTLRIFNLSNKITFFLLTLISIPILANTETLLSWWLGEVHEYMVPFVQLMLLSIVIQNLGMPFTTIAQGAGKIKIYHLCVDGFMLCFVPIIYILLKSGAEPTLVLVLSVGLFLGAHFIRLFATRSIVGLSVTDYLLRFLLPSILIFTSLYFVALSCNGLVNNSLLKVIISAFVSTVCLILFSSFFIFDRHELAKIIEFINKKVHK